MNPTSVGGRFQAHSLEPGITYKYLPHNKWKTLSINVFCKIPIARHTVTPIALVPRLAKRGTDNLPTMRELSRRLEDMFGAGVGADVSKIGPMQVVRFGINLPSPEFLGAFNLGEGEQKGASLEEAMALIWDLVQKPYLERGVYPSDRFDTEREEHRRDVLGIINNRPRYAGIRLMEELSSGDPGGLPAWGTIEDLEKCNPTDTWNIWADSLSCCEISIYGVGDGVDKLRNILDGGKLEFPKGRVDSRNTPADRFDAPNLPQGVLEKEEYLPGEQTVLCMAYHTGITEAHPLLPAFIFFDGILGGFPHSKLFVNVREREHLAYFADSGLNTWRGVLTTVAGVMDPARGKARDLMEQQVLAMKKGDITDEEMENTRAGLLRRYRSESDSQSALVRRFLTQEILGGPATEKELVEQVMRVKKEEVVEVANRAQLKAVYTLRCKEN